MVAHANFLFVPDDRFPEAKSGGFGDGFDDKHGFGVAVEVEVAIFFEDAVEFGAEVGEAIVGEDGEPVVAGGFAVFEAGGGADAAVFFEGFVGGIGDDQVYGAARKGLEPCDRVGLIDLEGGTGCHGGYCWQQIVV